MKFNRIMAVIFGLIFGIGSLFWIIFSLSDGKSIDFSAVITMFIGFAATFWGIKELRKKEIKSLGKQTEKQPH